MKQTAMQNLKEDLIFSQTKGKKVLSKIKNQRVREACQEVFELTLSDILKRIDDELLEMERQQIIEARLSLDQSIHFEDALDEAEQYYNETFKIKQDEKRILNKNR